MTEYVYWYEPRGYSPGYAYRSFDDALAHFLEDSRVSTITELIRELDKYGVWHDIDPDNERISVDDGGHITKVELR